MFDGRNNLNDTLEDQKRTTAGIYGYRGLGLWCSMPLQTFFSYIVAISFIGGRKRLTQRKPLQIT
jgi:hypothetical protein